MESGSADKVLSSVTPVGFVTAKVRVENLPELKIAQL
jgi:hypothetical protein